MSILQIFRSLFPRRKSVPAALGGRQWTGTSYVDAYKRQRAPTANELMAELKNTAYACIAINSAVCASNPPDLYVTTERGQPGARCLTKALPGPKEMALRGNKNLPPRITKAMKIEQVLDHPLLTLFAKINPVHNAYDLWELTTLYQEVHGSAYWYVVTGPLGVPTEIWPLPPQNVMPTREPGSKNLVDYYVYRNGASETRYPPERIIHFKYPDPKDPYLSGLSPLRACFEQVALTSDYAAMKKAIYDNQAIPSAIVSPAEVLGEEERDRYETQWNHQLRRGGSGKIIVAESALNVHLLQHSMGDLAQLAEIRATMEDICNAFAVPIAYMTTNTNMANLQAAERQHMKNCIHPRLKRRDEKINEQLVPLFDDSRRLFVTSEDPTPIDPEVIWQQAKVDMQFGIRTINEMRESQGLDPVPWGDKPFLPANWLPADQRREPKASGKTA